MNSVLWGDKLGIEIMSEVLVKSTNIDVNHTCHIMFSVIVPFLHPMVRYVFS